MGKMKDIIIGLGVMLIVITGISAFFLFGVTEFGMINYPELNLLGTSDDYQELIGDELGQIDNSTIESGGIFGDAISGISLIIKQASRSVKWLGFLSNSGGSITTSLPLSPAIGGILISLIGGVMLVIIISIFLRWNV